MLNLNSIMINTTNLKEMIPFYETLLGRKADMVMEEKYYGWDAGSCYLTVGEHSEMTGKSQQGARILVNFETTQVKEEFERMKAAGATVIKEPYSMDDDESNGMIATIADPDGNYFQFVTPWEQ